MGARLYLLAAAALFSTGGAAIKGTTLSSWQVASLRSLVAAIALLILLPAARQRWSPGVAGAAVAYAVTLVAFAVATKLTTGANAIFLQSTGPLYLLAIGPLFLHEKLRRLDLALGAVVALGMALFFVDPAVSSQTAPDPARGNLYGALSGLGWGITVAALRALERKGVSSLAVVATGNLFAFAGALPFAWPLTQPGPTDWAVLLYLGIIQIGLAYWCLGRGMREVPAFEASALLLLEPALNPVWTWILHGESPSPYAIAGGSLILGAALWGAWRKPGIDAGVDLDASAP